MKKIILSIFVLVTPMLSFGQEIQQCSNNEVTKTDVSCFSGNDGKITITKSALEVKYIKLINITENKIVRDFTTDKEFEFLSSGSYRIISQDTMGNLCYTDITITQPEELKLTTGQIITSKKPSKDKMDGSITINFTGGKQPYTLYINNSDKSLDKSFNLETKSITIDSLNSGFYTIIIKDKNGCQTKGIHHDLIDEGNFNHHFETKEKTCLDTAEYKITITDGQKPFIVTVSRDNIQEVYRTINQDSFVYHVSLRNGYGNYVVTIVDKRGNPVKLSFQHKDIDCNLKVNVDPTSKPNYDNPTNGRIQIKIQNEGNGSSPYSLTIIDNQTGLNHQPEIKITTTVHEFVNLKEGSYKLIVIDAKGREFSDLIRIESKYMSGEEAKNEFEKNRSILTEKLNTCNCHKKRLENTQVGFRIAIAVVGLVGTVSTAGVGTLFGGIISGLATAGGTLTNEFAPIKKLDALKLRSEKLNEIKKLYDNYSLSNFNIANWNSQKAYEYEEFKKDILEEESNLKDDDFIPECNRNPRN